MTGQKIVLPSAFSDTTLPVLRDDTRLTYGSLALIDPSHPANPWASGYIPNDADTVPNIAWKEAAALLGAGTQASLAGLVTKPTQFTSAVGVLERSSKGGLHAIMSASAAFGTGKGMGIRPAQGIADWIVANPTHKYYISLWMKITRFNNENGSPMGFALNSSPSQAAQSLALIGGANDNLPSGAARLGQRRSRLEWRLSSDAALAAPFADATFSNIAVNGNTGTANVTGSAAQAQMKLFGAGMVTPFGTSTAGYRSELLWSAYLEDLTVSGRTYAQVDAIDYAEYQKQCLTAGGRYYNDTYTTPALA